MMTGRRLTLDPEQRQECEDAAFAVVVDAHRDRDVLDRRHDDQRPDHQREHSERRGWIRRARGEAKNRLERVERAGPDIAENHAQGRQAERGQASGDRRPRRYQSAR